MNAADEYVALGSSFAAGPGLRPRAAHSPRAAGRSENNYPHLIAHQLGFQLDDRSYSGATIAQIAGVDSTHRSVPQVSAVGADTRLVTVTGGGNDVGYITRLMLASLPRPLRLPYVRERIRTLGEPGAAERSFERLRANLDTLIRTIRSRSDAVIVITDYLTVLPDDGRDLTPLPAEIALWGREMATHLSSTLSSVAQHCGAIFVPIADASATHHAWSDQPWTRTFHFGPRGGAAYHPTADGMAAVARLVLRAVPQFETRS